MRIILFANKYTFYDILPPNFLNGSWLVKHHVSENVDEYSHFSLCCLHPQWQDLFCSVDTEPSHGSLGSAVMSSGS